MRYQMKSHIMKVVLKPLKLIAMSVIQKLGKSALKSMDVNVRFVDLTLKRFMVHLEKEKFISIISNH